MEFMQIFMSKIKIDSLYYTIQGGCFLNSFTDATYIQIELMLHSCNVI